MRRVEPPRSAVPTTFASSLPLFSARSGDCDEPSGPRSRPLKWVRRTRQRTPKLERVISTIKVMEPTHPLFGKTLKLLSERCGRGKAFIALGLEDGRRRLILRSATDLDSTKRHSRLVPFVSARSLLPLARHIQNCLTGLNLEASHESRPSSRTNSAQLKSRAQPSTASAERVATRSPSSARSADRSDSAAYSRRPRAKVVLITSGEGAERVTTAHRAKLAYIYRNRQSRRIRQCRARGRSSAGVH